MSEEGSPRPRMMRRLVLAIARAVALLILVAGFSGALAIGLPKVDPVRRYIAALVLGVVIFEALRPRPRQPVLPPDLVEAQRQIDELRAESEARANALAGMRKQVDRAESDLAEAHAAASEHERLRNAEADQAERREREAREKYEAENEHLQRAASKALEEIQRTRATSDELRTKAERERQSAATLKQTADELRAQLERERQSAAKHKQTADEHRTQAERELQNAATLKQTADELRAQVERERQSAAKHKQTADEHRMQVDRERQGAATLKQTAEALVAERRKLEAQVADVDGRLASAVHELEALRAERQRARRDIEEAGQKSETEKAAQRTAINAEWNAKLQHAAGAHSNELGAAQTEVRRLSAHIIELQQELEQTRKQADIEKVGLRSTQSNELAAAHNESKRMNARVEELEEQLGESRTHAQQLLSASQDLTRQLDEERQRFQVDLERLSGDHESKMAEWIAARQTAQDDVQALTMRLDEMRQDLERAKSEPGALRSSIEAEWGAKLQKIVNELTIDHENQIGDSLAAREAARAEVRSMNLKVQDLERQLQSARDGRLGLLQRDDQLTQDLEAERQARQRLEEEIATLRSQTFDEKAIRDKVEAEWSEKLQTIVNHIASDHESDIGKAIEEREAARAEARNLAIKISALQQKLDGERQGRDALQEKLRAAQDEVVALRNAPTLPMPAMDVEPKDERQARAEVLQFAEQANEVLRRISSPGTVPVPAAEEKKARILFVHHDPALRSLWRDNLGKSGFDVHTAVDGLEGLRLAMAEKPDVVIADASMPKMDGRELCQLLKSNQETASVKVILMTGIYTTEAPAESAAREFEADEMLRKPVKLEAMKSALTSLLGAPS